jgi:dUTP pyrophosphatase
VRSETRNMTDKSTDKSTEVSIDDPKVESAAAVGSIELIDGERIECDGISLVGVMTRDGMKLDPAPTRPISLPITLSPIAMCPERGSEMAAGLDLFSSINVTIPPHSRMFVGTGVSADFSALTRVIGDGSNALTLSYFGRVLPRSGLASKGIDIGAGVIDSDYRGEIKVLVCNNSDVDFNVGRGTKIAQMVIELANMCPVTVLPSLSKTERGAKGFGSTG